MTRLHESRPASPPRTSTNWTGWVSFAAIVLALNGTINLVQGLVALLDHSYYLVRSGDRLLLVDYAVWGVVLLIWGTLEILGGFALSATKAWARWFALLVACSGDDAPSSCTHGICVASVAP